ncbi:protein rodD [Aspergillus fumigatus Af293]|uniref:Hydrophobin-like protein rodD n=2 Tax=Aspergillus fumigatus TaxID=746128 RepID=RODD_ASPFU|nr:hypothetical protein AFUA_5G01490 [Aspergillus fumigatus Af293]EAL86155.1 hypothetical protein AFUA_5G01490 [Aspergillus fumigatus Af293]EDP51001.1 hypothetical protein AFUB_050030 [Aspergillus fumigatus A1163]
MPHFCLVASTSMLSASYDVSQDLSSALYTSSSTYKYESASARIDCLSTTCTQVLKTLEIEHKLSMKVFATLFLLAASATAALAAVPAPNAGCSQPGQYCNGGTFLCCNNRQCNNNVRVPYSVPGYARNPSYAFSRHHGRNGSSQLSMSIWDALEELLVSGGDWVSYNQWAKYEAGARVVGTIHERRGMNEID